MLNTAAAQLVWYDMKVNGNWLYTVSASAPHNVRAFDRTTLRRASGPNKLFADAGRHLPKVTAHNSAISDKANPVRFGLLDYARVPYTHQGWISEDHRSFYLSDENNEQAFGG